MKAWRTQNRYMQIEGFAEPADKIADLKPLQIAPKAACTRKLHHIDGRYRGFTEVCPRKQTASRADVVSFV
jgi:hypothetical protein